MNRGILQKTLAVALILSQTAYAGEFYKLYPQWLESLYYLLLALFIIGSIALSYFIFSNLKGGKLGRPWIFIMAGLGVWFIRTIMGILTAFDVQYFQAAAFAGLDILFFILLLAGLILYKIGLE
jgi:hypothetical protein